MENLSEEQSSAELITDYANLIWRWAWLLVLCALLAGGTAYWASSRQTPIYEASTLVMVDAAPTSQTVTYTSLTTSEQLLATYSKLMTTEPLLDGVAKLLGLPTFPETASIQVQPILNTQLMTVNVQDTDPARAALLANTLVQVFSDQIQADQASRYADSKTSLEDQLASLEQQIKTTSDDLAALGNGDTNPSRLAQLQTALAQYRLSYASVLQSYEQIKLAQAQSSSGIIQKAPALPPDAPIKPRPVRDAALAAVVGLMLAAGIVFLIEFLDDTLRDPQEITRKWGIPILGMITRYKSNGSPLITIKQPRAPVSEAFRSLRTNLEFAAVDSPLKTILVTSASPQDGKTTIAANLACVIAQGKHSVVVVDADLRRPQIHKQFQLMNRLGLTNKLIQPKGQLYGSLQNTELPVLKVITSGSLPPDPSELLGSIKMQELMSSLKDQFDFLIIDTPPVLMVTDAVVLAPRVDGVIIVVKPSVTKRGELHHVIEQMKQVNARVLGVVLNDVDVGRARYYYYRQYSSYKYKYYKGYYSREASPKEEKSPAPTNLMKGRSPAPASSGKEKTPAPPGSEDVS